MDKPISIMLFGKLFGPLSCRGISAHELESTLFTALIQLAEELKIGDHVELPNGTQLTCTFKP